MSIRFPDDSVTRNGFGQHDAQATRRRRANGKGLDSSRNKPAQLAIRTKWSLSYMLDIQKTAREQMAIILEGFKDGHIDARMGRAIAQLALCNAEMENALHDARAGRYEGPMIVDKDERSNNNATRTR